MCVFSNQTVIARQRVGAKRRPMTGSSGRSSIPEALMAKPSGRGVLDAPPEPVIGLAERRDPVAGHDNLSLGRRG
jgi:hypothetical protein